jgi:hypothetical protein
MKYLVELVKKNKPDVEDSTLEYVVSFLIKEGHLSYTIQYHYDIFDFYTKALERYNELGLQKKCAFIDTTEHFKIKKSQLYNIIKQFSKK